MTTIDKLTEYFAEFPGIGPRQAQRFVYYLLTRNPEYIENFLRLVGDLKNHVHICSLCYRFFQTENHKNSLCEICRNNNRDKSVLTIVSRDVDLDKIEKTHALSGLYFVLGGSVPILEKTLENRIRQKELINTVMERIKNHKLSEIILALNATPEGENTAEYVASLLRSTATEHGIKISHLGRGISTGTELEYSDSDTIKNALKNRS